MTKEQMNHAFNHYIAVIIIMAGHQWGIVDKRTNDFINTGKPIRTGQQLVDYCNKHRLAVENSQNLIPELREQLDVRNTD